MHWLVTMFVNWSDPTGAELMTPFWLCYLINTYKSYMCVLWSLSKKSSRWQLQKCWKSLTVNLIGWLTEAYNKFWAHDGNVLNMWNMKVPCWGKMAFCVFYEERILVNSTRRTRRYSKTSRIFSVWSVFFRENSFSFFCNGAIVNRSKYAMVPLLISWNRCKMNKTLARVNLSYMREVYQTISALSPSVRTF